MKAGAGAGRAGNTDSRAPAPDTTESKKEVYVAAVALLAMVLHFTPLIAGSA